MGAGFHCCGPFESSDKPRLEGRQREVDMRGAEPDEPEMSFRRGYQQGAIELFYAIERFLDPATREVVRAEIAPELTGHGLPLGKCEAYNRVYDQFYQSR